MNNLLDHALEIVRALPPAEQEEIARAMLALADTGEDQEEIDPDDLADVLEGLAQAERGELGSSEQVQATFRRFLP